MLLHEHILDGMPDGVVVLNEDNVVVWANQQFRRWSTRELGVDSGFYALMGGPEILGPDFCPFNTAFATGEPSTTTLRTQDNRFFRVHAVPLADSEGNEPQLVVTIRDVTTDEQQLQKLAAIHKAGVELANLKPEEVYRMDTESRVELLKSNIVHYTQGLLRFDVVEIRLLDQASGELKPLLSEGLDQEAAERPLFARTNGNGVTGFVAATGQSYLCEDTTDDPLYLTGFVGAKSSLTVPLVLHETVIGTFNVESPKPQGFSDSDLQFLEIFARDVAVALNTLDLLLAQKANAAQASVEAIHSAVALPVDEILNEAVTLLEQYPDQEPMLKERLQRILRKARDIRQVIHTVGQSMKPAQAIPVGDSAQDRPLLRNRRVLVVDHSDEMRTYAHAMLEPYGCSVETAHNGVEAVGMVRSLQQVGGHDIIISDIDLPDMTGYDLMMKLKDILGVVPMILASGFGWDAGHTVFKARKEGLHAKGIVFKPYRDPQLPDAMETVMAWVKSGDCTSDTCG